MELQPTNPAEFDVSAVTEPIKAFGHTLVPHVLTRPRVAGRPEYGDMEVFAREIIPPGGEELPLVVKLQGGPGCPSPRPVGIGSWFSPLLKKYRVLLLDQRGTGYSDPLDSVHPLVTGSTPEELADLLIGLRADAIVDDVEAFREYFNQDQVSLFGQSYGGFCATTYMSRYPDKLAEVYLTGGLPATTVGIDDVYRATYHQVKDRHRAFFKQYPFAEARIREIAHHLDNHEEILPTGERLTSRRFRTLGISLGRGTGFATLAWLLERPFHEVKGEKRLTGAFLNAVGANVSMASTPLYGALHESIYGGTVPGATNWSAHRIRETIEGFEENADPTDFSAPYLLTGEHIYPWMFEEDPALRPYKDAVEILAAKDDWESLYNHEKMAETTATGAAAVYAEDIFVPNHFSLTTASHMRDMRCWVTNEFQHDGIRDDGAGVVSRLIDMVADH